MGQRHRQSSRSLKPPVREFVHRLVLLVIGTSIAYRTKAAAAALLHLYPEHLINLYSVVTLLCQPRRQDSSLSSSHLFLSKRVNHKISNLFPTSVWEDQTVAILLLPA